MTVAEALTQQLGGVLRCIDIIDTIGDRIRARPDLDREAAALRAEIAQAIANEHQHHPDQLVLIPADHPMNGLGL